MMIFTAIVVAMLFFVGFSIGHTNGYAEAMEEMQKQFRQMKFGDDD